MSDQLYSAEEAATILGLQVRTVRNYVRDGRLAGARIGKQYRIARADLEAFTGGGIASTEITAPTQPPVRRVEVSSVIEVDAVDAEAADRVTRTLEAVLAGRADDAQPLRVEPLYNAERLRMKIIVVGEAVDTVELIRLVDAVA
jgi:excisionase family DNA binding protein